MHACTQLIKKIVKISMLQTYIVSDFSATIFHESETTIQSGLTGLQNVGYVCDANKMAYA